MIFTQFDKFRNRIRGKLVRERPNASTEDIDLFLDIEFKRKLEDEFIKPLRSITNKDDYPHAVVSSRVSLKYQSSMLTSNFQHVRLTENLSGISSKPHRSSSPKNLG